MKYITGKQAQLILNITTRQGLHKIVKAENIFIKSQGAGKANLYLESDIKEVAKKTNAQRLKTNPRLKKKIETKIKVIKEKIKVNKVKKNETEKFQKEDESKTVLSEIGKNEYSKIKKLLEDNGTLDEVDDSLLQAYAISYQEFFTYSYEITKRNGVDENEAGELKPTIYIGMKKTAFDQMKIMAGMLGIGVRNRIGVDVKKEKKVSVFDMLNQYEKF